MPPALLAHMTSTHHERMRKALRGDTTDRIPRGEFFISDEFARAFLNLPPAQAVEFHHFHAIVESLDHDVASVPLSAGWGALEQPDQDRAVEMVMQWAAAGTHFVVALIDGPFSAAVRARGLTELLHYVRGAPHVARALFQRGAEETLVVARAVREAGADGVILGEDIAYGRSTFLSPTDVQDIYLPELGVVARELHALGLVAMFHSDGNLSAILPGLAQCGLDGIQGLEPEAGMEMSAVRSLVGPTVTLWGNMGFEMLSAPRTDAEIEAVVQSIAAGVPQSPTGQSGKLILGSSAGLVQGMNVDTVRRVYQRR